MRIKFDTEICTWQCLGDDRDIRRVEAEARILEVIESLDGAYAKNIAEELEISLPTVYTHLKRMVEDGSVEFEVDKTSKSARKLFRIPKETGATSPTQLLGNHGVDSKSSRGSRGIGEVGAKFGDTKNSPTAEDFAELRRQLRDVPNGDISEIVASHLATIEV